MPNTHSAAKAMRSSEKKRMRNQSIKSALKTSLSRAEKLIAQGSEEAGKTLLKAASALDKAAQSGIIHANNAARHKSHLAKKMNLARKLAIAALPAVAPEPLAAKTRKPTTRRAKPKS